MAIFKCKMCGGALEITEGRSVTVCEYCGTQQTLPKLDDDRRANMYDRANHFRRSNEYDKAMGIYEQILNEDNTDAEAYWSLVLCRYGIEYVEDPATKKRIPTVNRAQYTSVFDDANYRSALEYADMEQRCVYESEAETINEIQKGILTISQKEEPFDVFICYKETDNNGRRTQDSVLANDLYHQLTQEGFKVFFARITLEDKLGSAYEPYIFAALNSAKVMVVLGTRPEFFNAVWVKNEWSRYLSLIRHGQKKVLVPAYKDMDPYDLPEEFSHLQAQDMSKLGFMQDLIRGIKKIVQIDKPAPVRNDVFDVSAATGTKTSTLIKRAFFFLEDEDWKNADDYCEKALDIDPECADAYLGKLMAELKVSRREGLKQCVEPIEELMNFQKTIRFGDDELKAELTSYAEYGFYNRIMKAMEEAETEEEYIAVAKRFEDISGFLDSAVLAKACYFGAEFAKKDVSYRKACKLMESDSVINYKAAISVFETIPGHRDANEQIDKCNKRIEEILARQAALRLEREKQEEEERLAEKRKSRKTTIWVLSVLFLVIGLFVGLALYSTYYPTSVRAQEKLNKIYSSVIGNEYTDRKGSVELLHSSSERTIVEFIGKTTLSYKRGRYSAYISGTTFNWVEDEIYDSGTYTYTFSVGPWNNVTLKFNGRTYKVKLDDDGEVDYIVFYE